MPCHVLSPSIPGVCCRVSDRCPAIFSAPPSPGVCWGFSGGSGAAGGRKSDESLAAGASPPHPLWALARSTSLRVGVSSVFTDERREAPGAERQVSLGAQRAPEHSASGSQGGPPEGSGSRKASDTGLLSKRACIFRGRRMMEPWFLKALHRPWTYYMRRTAPQDIKLPFLGSLLLSFNSPLPQCLLDFVAHRPSLLQ